MLRAQIRSDPLRGRGACLSSAIISKDPNVIAGDIAAGLDLIDALSPVHVIHGVESNIVFGNDCVPNQLVPHPLDSDHNGLHAAMRGSWILAAVPAIAP